MSSVRKPCKQCRYTAFCLARPPIVAAALAWRRNKDHRLPRGCPGMKALKKRADDEGGLVDKVTMKKYIAENGA